MTCSHYFTRHVLALAAWFAPFASAAGPALREYDVLRAFPAGRLAALSANDQPDANGLNGSNRQNGSWLEAGPQRGGCRAVVAGIALNDLAKADDGWRAIDTAFAHQRPDGGFEARVRPNGESAQSHGASVETAYFFLQELGRAVLVIRQSPYEAHFHARIVEIEPKMRRACDFILDGYDTIITNSGKAVNRIFIAAKAFGLCGLALNEQRFIDASRRLVKFGLTLRDKDGVFIENGGRDSSYNVVSILFGQVLALHLPLPELDAAFPAAVAWQLTRIRESGEVNVTGNTRTGVGKESSYFGEPKKVNYPEVVYALTLYGIVHHDAAALKAADRVFEYAHRSWTGKEGHR